MKLDFYLTAMSSADGVRAVRPQHIVADAPPAITLVGVSKLAAPQYMVKIEAVAAIAPSPT